MKFKITVLIISFALVLGTMLFMVSNQESTAQAGPWTATMNATTATEGNNPNLAFGVALGGTDSYDAGTDIPHSPLGPGFDLDSYFEIDHFLFDKLDKDYRGTVPNSWTFHANCPSEPIDLTWDTSGVPPDISLQLTGSGLDVNMQCENSASLPSGANTLIITATYFPVPDVYFTTDVDSVMETAGTYTVNVELSAISTREITVGYATSDNTANAGSDYTATSGTLTFTPGDTSETFNIPITNDTDVEGDQTLFVDLFGECNVAMGTPNHMGLTISDDDVPNVHFSAANYNVNEPAGPAVITVNLSEASPGTITVQYNTSDGTAVQPGDYTAASGTLTFVPGDTSKTFNVPIIDDGLVEPDETVNLTLSNATGTVSIGAPNPATLTIDSEDVVDVEFAQAIYTVSEAGGSASIEVVLSEASPDTVTVQYATSDNTAVAPGDYTTTNGTLTFIPGDTSETFNVPIINDANVEGDESLDLQLSNPGNANLGAQNAATLNISDDDVPNVYFSAATYNINEPAGPAVITVNLSEASPGTITVQYNTSDGTAVQPGDYTATTGTLTFSPGDTSENFNVPIVDDGLVEPDETVILTLSNTTGSVSIGSPNPATLTIDSEDVVDVEFAQAVYTVSEAGGSASIEVILSEASPDTVTVQYATSDNTASAGSDYTAASGTLTFVPGDTSETFNVPIINDTDVEGDESVDLQLGNPGNANLGAQNTATLNISDDDVPNVYFSAATYNINEPAGPAVITVNLSEASPGTITVQYNTSDGTAVQPGDYTAASGTLTFVTGDTSETFNVPVIDDGLVEPDETVNLTLSNATGTVSIGAPNPATLTIDSEDVVDVMFSQAVYTVSEAGGSASIEVILSEASPDTVTVQYATSDNTANAGSDYTSASGTLTFTPGDTSETFNVPIINDTDVEGDESVDLQLNNAGNACLAVPFDATLDITDDDIPDVYFSAANYNVNETAGTIAIDVLLNQAGAGTIMVNYGSSDGTANDGLDYTGVSGTLTFVAGDTVETFNVPIINDGIGEGDETFNLALTNPINANLGVPSTAVVTIIDDEAPQVSTVGSSAINEDCVMLQGMLVDTGTAPIVTVSFEWGTDTSYGNNVFAGAMTAPGPFSGSICGLAPNITYHFRAVAQGEGTDYGDDDTFIIRGGAGGTGGMGGPTVGGTIYPVNKMALILPWIRFGLSMFL